MKQLPQGLIVVALFGALGVLVWSNRLSDNVGEAERKAAEFAARTKAQVKQELEQLSGQPRMLGVTMEAYTMLHPGMTDMDAWAIIGSEGVEQSSAGSVVTKRWQDGSKVIVATFQNGRLVGKSQVGL